MINQGIWFHYLLLLNLDRRLGNTFFTKTSLFRVIYTEGELTYAFVVMNLICIILGIIFYIFQISRD